MVVAVYLGAPWFDLLIIAVAVVLAWEWARLTHAEALRSAVLTGFLVGAVGAATVAGAATGLIVLGAAFVALLTPRGVGRGTADGADSRWRAPLWPAVGVLYAGLPCIGLIWIRAAPETGRDTVLWLLAVVWATDIAAYAAGRLLGGPKLAPRISPNKTWSGLLGGVAAAAAVGAGTAVLLDVTAVVALIVASALLAIVEQGGDLVESWLKRRTGTKDTSNLIPGHGGLFDRVDGLIAATGAVAVFGLVDEGGVLAWS